MFEIQAKKNCVFRANCSLILYMVVVIVFIGSLAFIKTTIKDTIHVTIENLFFFYRCCLLVPIWMRYIWNLASYPIAFSIFVTIVYPMFKLGFILDTLFKCLIPLHTLLSNRATCDSCVTREEFFDVHNSAMSK